MLKLCQHCYKKNKKVFSLLPKVFFNKVEAFASLVASKEKVNKQTSVVISILGYIHDIGIKFAEEKFGKCTGPI